MKRKFSRSVIWFNVLFAKPGRTVVSCFFFMLCTEACLAANNRQIYGNWVLVKSLSSPVMYYDGCSIEIKNLNAGLQLEWKWDSKFSFIDSLDFQNGVSVSRQVQDRVWPYQNFMGVSFIPGTKYTASMKWVVQNTSLDISTSYPVRVSQGRSEIETYYHYKVSSDGNQLTVWVKRNFRPDTLKYVFERGSLKHAYYYTLDNTWALNDGLAHNAFVISLQGIINKKSSQLYLIYPDGWEYREDKPLKDFYEKELGYAFTQLNTEAQLLDSFCKDLKGYIIADTTSRSSLCVAFTLAGIKDAVVIPESMLPLMKKYHLKCVDDLREKYAGMSDYEIFKSAYRQYADQCSKKFVVWMGGVGGHRMMPAIADFGISQKAFFADLSTNPKDTLEYNLASCIMRRMKPLSLIMGWHSYNKDLERNYVTLASHHGLRVEGLNTFPNLSFTSRTPPSPGFEFRNNHNIKPETQYIPQKKVYITCVQTDGLGLGAWNRPGRGSIPYAWEVTINWYWLAPVLLEYYYKNATKNDFFFGSLSGPGYMYPKAIPDSLFPALMKVADSLCRKLDINVFETMDYSQGTSGSGNNDLPKSTIEKYFANMKDMIGILNGYAPSYTFGKIGNKPFISYDYYLDEHLPESSAVNDLKELIGLNSNRPYFLALHVREWNDIDRVKRIIAQLGNNVEVVPLDVFMKMAGSNFTYKENYLAIP